MVIAELNYKVKNLEENCKNIEYQNSLLAKSYQRFLIAKYSSDELKKHIAKLNAEIDEEPSLISIDKNSEN